MAGRPRNLPEEEAVELALELFWARGYERTSIADLSEALGVGPSGLYNAFGNKEQLFRRAIEHYVSRYTDFLGEAASAKLDVEPLIRGLLRDAVRAYTTPGRPLGCAVMQSGGAAGAAESKAAAITLEVKAELEQQLRGMLAQASRAHGTKLAAPAGIVAKYLVGTMRGLSQLAIDGATVREMRRVGDLAARACVVHGEPSTRGG